ncbi:uncharacterized protein BDV17DRAFT_1603 [Aspergillus undulatus]|uniref:uncharacterized protein n=1 Tax=Aspergillus undulatus TaxID=1810928 RepID=UPI003CCD1799
MVIALLSGINLGSPLNGCAFETSQHRIARPRGWCHSLQILANPIRRAKSLVAMFFVSSPQESTTTARSTLRENNVICVLRTAAAWKGFVCRLRCRCCCRVTYPFTSSLAEDEYASAYSRCLDARISRSFKSDCPLHLFQYLSSVLAFISN